MQTANDNVVRILPVPIDDETRKLLDAFARIVRKPAPLAARDLLRSLLTDDAATDPTAYRPF